ncbi:hypothetical protein [Actinomadura madurae]|uniref:hypothetical protein n=1 Tax=Actinomadura madurae TaxID=1993 RepID=UPI0027E31EE9|nr:hypothetical protein [Actinomadura madurae]
MASGAPGAARSGKYDRYAAVTPSSAGSQVSWSAQSKGTPPDRDPTRTGQSRAVSRWTTRRPVLPVPPVTRVMWSVISLLLGPGAAASFGPHLNGRRGPGWQQ